MIDLTNIQQGIWDCLQKIDYTVVDYIEFDSIEPPFVHLGSLYIKDNSVKNGEGIVCTQYINIYSVYSGKKEMLTMINAVNQAMDNLVVEGQQVYVKQGRTSVVIDKDKFSSIFQRTDRNNNKFYHAVLIFDLYIN